MKMVRIIAGLMLVTFFCSNAMSQAYNWKSLSEKQSVINLNTGYEYGLVTGLGYGYRVKSKIPLIIHGDYSFPAGNNLLDDFKARIGTAVRLYQNNGFEVSIDMIEIFRRSETDQVRMLNFGSETKAAIGYYTSRWFVAGDVRFDKAIVTHLKHSPAFKENFPGVKDGWYIPTGGNFLYGVQGGFSFSKTDLYIKGGKVISDDFKLGPQLPYYAELGINFRF